MTRWSRRRWGAAGASPRLHCGHLVTWLPVGRSILIQLVGNLVGRIRHFIRKFGCFLGQIFQRRVHARASAFE